MRLSGIKSFGGIGKFRLYSALFVTVQAHSTTLSSPGLSEVVLRPGREGPNGRMQSLVDTKRHGSTVQKNSFL